MCFGAAYSYQVDDSLSQHFVFNGKTLLNRFEIIRIVIYLLAHGKVFQHCFHLNPNCANVPETSALLSTGAALAVPLFCLKVGHEDTGQNIPNIGVGFTSSNLRHLQGMYLPLNQSC